MRCGKCAGLGTERITNVGATRLYVAGVRLEPGENTYIVCQTCGGSGSDAFKIPPPEVMKGYEDQFGGTDDPTAEPIPPPPAHCVCAGAGWCIWCKRNARAPEDELQKVFDVWAQKLQRAQLVQSEATWLRTILGILIVRAGGELRISSKDIAEFATSSRQIEVTPEGERLDEYDLVLRVRS
jgi:hypothetical protein